MLTRQTKVWRVRSKSIQATNKSLLGFLVGSNYQGNRFNER